MKIYLALLLLVVAASGAAFAQGDQGMNETEPVSMDIVDTVAADDNFSTLLTAIEVAGLGDTLKSEGPFTVFAPTDEAFDGLLEGTLDSLLNDTQQLVQVLTYHVVGGMLTSSDLVNDMNLTTLQGGNLTVTVSEDGVMVNGANVVMADVECSNGVIHGIDGVLMP